MGKIRKTDNAPFTHAKHFSDDETGMTDFLEGLAEDHVIERLIGEIGEALINITVVDGEALADAFINLFFRDLDPGPFNLLFIGQELK